MDRMKELGSYEESLIVVVADHGIGFLPPGAPGQRDGTRNNFGEIGFVPLIIKYPHQEAGEIDASNVQTIDIVPTIADVLDARSERVYDGRSLVDEDAAAPTHKRLARSKNGIIQFSEEEFGELRSAALRGCIRRFNLDDPGASLFHVWSGTEYIGATVASLGGAQDSG
jgi:arylsulfatase A-like enzyme